MSNDDKKVLVGSSASINRPASRGEAELTVSVDQDLHSQEPSTERPVSEIVDGTYMTTDADETLGIMMQTQDPHFSEDNMSNNQALMNLIKGNIGTGLLAMPSVVKYSGLWMGVAFIGIMGIIATYLMHILLHCARDLRDRHGVDRTKMDYTETVFLVFKYGPQRFRKYKGKIKHTVNGFLIITQVGFCCVYVLFCITNIKPILNYIWPKSEGSVALDDKLIGFYIAIFLIPFSFIKNLKYFAYLSVLANLTTVCGILLILTYCMLELKDWTEFDPISSANDLLIAFGIIVFSFEGISLVLPIENKMKDPDAYSGYNGVLNTAMVWIISLYIFMGFFGFLRFGEETAASITVNIPFTPGWCVPVKPLFIFSIFISYLLQFYVPAHIFGRLMEKIYCHREATDKRRYIHIHVMRICLVFLTYLMAVLIPDLDLMISLVGSISSSALAIIIPPILDTVNNWQIRSTLPRWKLRLTVNIILVLFGLLGFVGGTLSTIIQIVKKHSE